tara:strand:+ start:448 stop:1182 length:735 start_codon:yes stop_codon:yes gene_type:complete
MSKIEELNCGISNNNYILDKKQRINSNNCSNNLINENNINNKFSKNCSKFDGGNNNFVLDSNTKLKDDVCNEKGTDIQNSNINDYMLSNYSSCECSLDNVMNTSMNNRGIIIKDGYGISECNIDSDTNLRVGDFKRHYKTDTQLFPRPYLTTPSITKGQMNPNLESRLQSSLMSKRHGQMQNYSQDNIYTPLLPNMIKAIKGSQQNKFRFSQNTTNILQQQEWRKTNQGYIARAMDEIYLKNQQ